MVDTVHLRHYERISTLKIQRLTAFTLLAHALSQSLNGREESIIELISIAETVTFYPNSRRRSCPLAIFLAETS